MRTLSEPVRGIVGPLLVGFALFFGGDFLGARFFATAFPVEEALPALDLLRALLEELAFFMVRILRVEMGM
jgi:hypothetical protein